MIITRMCAVCGKELKIAVREDGIYEGGHYFGRIQIPRGKIMSEKKDRLGNMEVIVVEHESYDEMEYWECNECYSEG